MRLTGKTILITAAGQGIGRATALACAAEGARVIATDLRADLLATLKGVETRALDVTDPQAVKAIAAELGLKAYLSSQGWSDDRCRQDIRHDLEKGLSHADKSGMVGTGDDLGDVIAVLNAYYQCHAFDRFDSDPAFASKARAEVARLLDVVRPYVEASGGR